jgi:hypothetical protein
MFCCRLSLPPAIAHRQIPQQYIGTRIDIKSTCDGGGFHGKRREDPLRRIFRRQLD